MTASRAISAVAELLVIFIFYTFYTYLVYDFTAKVLHHCSGESKASQLLRLLLQLLVVAVA